MVYKSVKSGAKGQVAYKELEEMLDTYERIFQSRPFNLDRHVANPVSEEPKAYFKAYSIGNAKFSVELDLPVSLQKGSIAEITLGVYMGNSLNRDRKSLDLLEKVNKALADQGYKGSYGSEETVSLCCFWYRVKTPSEKALKDILTTFSPRHLEVLAKKYRDARVTVSRIHIGV